MRKLSEDHDKIILKSLSDAVIAIDKNGRVTFMNPLAETLTGWTDNEARGKLAVEVFHIIAPNTRQGLENQVEWIINGGTLAGPANYPVLISRNGSERRIAGSVSLIHEAEGNSTGQVLIFRDVTRECLMHDALRECEERFRAIFNATFQFIGLLTPDGTLIEANQAALDFGRTNLEEVINQPFWETHWWRGNEAQKQQLQEAVARAAKGEFVRFTAEYKRSDGRIAIVDFSIKPIFEPDGKVMLLVPEGRDITAINQVEEALRENEERFRTLFETAQDAIFLMDGDIFIECNSKALDVFGCDGKSELLNHSTLDFSPAKQSDGRDSHEKAWEYINAALQGNPQRFYWKNCRKDGAPIDMEVSLNRINLKEKTYLQAIGRDITERQQAEAEKQKLQDQLAQAQKMESIGRLAGGVAHDFNNMLCAILGFSELALEKTEPGQLLRDDLEEIISAARRSVDLTRQLLAFARKQTSTPKILDLNETVEDMLKMLRRIIGEDIDLVWIPDHDLQPVKIDPVQIDQILANLLVNSRDSIAGVGKVTIETKNVVCGQSGCVDRADCRPGEYIMLAVSDNGCGMPREIHAKIFEPFFTTKKPGKGTGLGLATVYGIVRQNNGFIEADSAPGKGTIFRIYLPRYINKAIQVSTEASEKFGKGGSETVLLVEDEQIILNLAERILEKNGYTVLAANTPGQAIRLAEEHVGDINLLLTDVVMPGMNGKELADRLLVLYPNLKLLYMSCHAANVIARHGILDKGVHFLNKPFTVKELATRVRERLDQDFR